MRKYLIKYNPMREDICRVEKTLEDKPATWELYEHEEGGKQKILEIGRASCRERV